MTMMEKVKDLFRQIKSWFAPVEDWEEEYEAEAAPQGKARELRPEESLPARALHPFDAVIMTPKSYSDARSMVTALEKGKVVMALLEENISREEAARLVDFMSGAVYLGKGQMELLHETVLICTPPFVALETDPLHHLTGIPQWRAPGT